MYRGRLLGVVILYCSALCGSTGLSEEVSSVLVAGVPVEELLARKGDPSSVMAIKNKRILKWPDLKVTVEDGFVMTVQHLNPLEEQQKSEQRKQIAELRMAEIQQRKEAMIMPAEVSKGSESNVAIKQPSRDEVDGLIKSAEDGNKNAQIRLGVWYRLGKGIKKDPSKAVYWFKKASEQGDADGDYYLGLLYANGEGVLKNTQTALSYLENAARRGERRSKVLLGKLYEDGTIGGRPDYEQAYYWYTRASMSSSSEGSKLRNAIKSKLSDEEINRANYRAATGINYGSSWSR